MQRLGVIGGLGPEATASLYLDVTARIAKRNQQLPDVIIRSVPSTREVDEAMVLNAATARHLADMTRWLDESVALLQRSDVDLCVLACNTLHWILRPLIAERNARFIDITDAVASELDRLDAEQALVLCTSGSRAHGVYDESHDRFRFLNAEDQRELDDVILGLVRDATNVDCQRRLEKLVDAQPGVDAVVLGCTDLFAFMRNEDRVVVDSLGALAGACVDQLVA